MSTQTAVRPGSITKNLGLEAWEGEGFARLHEMIRLGFAGQLAPVERDVFRERTREPLADRQLVLLNFFLHDRYLTNHVVSSDDLVRLAVTEKHSPDFDKVALFALHLAKVGRRSGNVGHSHGASYLRDFVFQRLWQDGRWQAEAIMPARIETFLEETILHKEGSDTVHKTMTNYSRFLKLAGFEPGLGDSLPPYEGTALKSALWLAFDRYTLDETPMFAPDAVRLIALSATDQLYKLLGLSEAELREPLLVEAHAYIAAGGLSRLAEQ